MQKRLVQFYEKSSNCPINSLIIYSLTEKIFDQPYKSSKCLEHFTKTMTSVISNIKKSVRNSCNGLAAYEKCSNNLPVAMNLLFLEIYHKFITPKELLKKNHQKESWNGFYQQKMNHHHELLLCICKKNASWLLH